MNKNKNNKIGTNKNKLEKNNIMRLTGRKCALEECVQSAL